MEATLRLTTIFLLLTVFAGPAAAQDETAAAANPMPELKDQVTSVLAEASLPFTDEQERAITLMMEDRRQSAEDLFRETMDFRAGPTQGQQVDRARDAIQWMRDEFLIRLKDYLTPEQLSVWSRFEEDAALLGGPAVRQQQTQYVRINNNSFTAEGAGFQGGGGGRTEVIQRGGIGEYHGNAEFLIQDESLNARNPFAQNKPPYQERQIRFDVSGPVIPGRLTLALLGNRNESENVDTVHAATPGGVFDLGIVRPAVNRSLTTRGTYQLADQHSLNFDLRYGTSSMKNQNVGGFNLPERGSDSRGSNWRAEVRQFSAPSPRTIYETRFIVSGNTDRTVPYSDALQINVLDAFRSGGAQNREEEVSRNYEFGNLYTRLGENLTIKTGFDGVYRTAESLSENNFTGAFTFSSLAAYLEERPLNFRVNRGDPRLEADQWEFAFFVQNDLKLTPRLTFMFGARYDYQTNLSDHNNLAPRMALAYAPGRATVIRVGAGVFFQRVAFNAFQMQMRQDGERQHEIVIDNPSYPDPFQSGTVRETFPSIRVTDPNLVAPYNTTASLSVERTFLSNLQITTTYEFNRGFKRYMARNLNAPYDLGAPVFPTSCTLETPADLCVRPDPTRGNILNMENSGNFRSSNLRFNVRQRFSIFTVSGGYTRSWAYDDFQPNNIQSYPSDNYNLRADWSRTPSARHSYNGTVNAQLPLGVFMTGSFNGNANNAYTITTGRDNNRDTVVNDRPAGVGRFTERAPGSFRIDLNISKAFFFGVGGNGTRANVNMFANMRNALNTPQLGRPSGVLTSPNYGKVTSASSPREIEAGLRFQF